MEEKNCQIAFHRNNSPSSVCGARRMSLATGRLRPSSTAAHAAPVLYLPPAALGLGATSFAALSRYRDGQAVRSIDLSPARGAKKRPPIWVVFLNKCKKIIS